MKDRVSQQNRFVHVAEVTKTYPGNNIPAVSDISFDLHAGEIVALLGPNGAGKTTTVKMIAGLVTPTSGAISVLGHDINRERRQAVKHMGAILEGARNLYWRLSAVENLRYFGSLRLVPRKVLATRIPELLTLFDLSEHQHKEVGKFSRGMQQKLAIAVALLHDPKILLLDEPTLGLDVRTARQLEKRIITLAKERGKTILLTTHMMELAEKLADSIFVIHQGRKVVYDSTRNLLAQHDGQRDVTDVEVTAGLPEKLLHSTQTMFPTVLIMKTDECIHFTLPAAEQREVMQLLNFLDEQGAEILKVGQRQARLEEVFLALTEAQVT